jgi:hypothetical protein
MIGEFTFSGGFQLSVTNLVDTITAFSSRGAESRSVPPDGGSSLALLPSAGTSEGGGAVYAVSTAPSPRELGEEATGRPEAKQDNIMWEKKADGGKKQNQK